MSSQPSYPRRDLVSKVKNCGPAWRRSCRATRSPVTSRSSPTGASSHGSTRASSTSGASRRCSPTDGSDRGDGPDAVERRRQGPGVQKPEAVGRAGEGDIEVARSPGRGVDDGGRLDDDDRVELEALDLVDAEQRHGPFEGGGRGRGDPFAEGSSEGVEIGRAHV